MLVLWSQSRSTCADVLDRVMEANGIQGEREYFGLLSPTAEPQPVRYYQTLANLPTREAIYKTYILSTCSTGWC